MSHVADRYNPVSELPGLNQYNRYRTGANVSMLGLLVAYLSRASMARKSRLTFAA